MEEKHAESMSEDETHQESGHSNNWEYERGEHELFKSLVDLVVKDLRLRDLGRKVKNSQISQVVNHGVDRVKDHNRNIVDGLRRAKSQMKSRVRNQREQVHNLILKSRQRWMEKRQDPPFCRFIDKIWFTLGILGTLVTATLPGRSEATTVMCAWYAFWMSTLIGIRIYLYWIDNYHYFVIDFCYFVNAMFGAYLFIYPDSSQLFMILFTFANGPLAWATILWKSSLVFHDIDKMTSSFIHVLPMLVTFQLRWFPVEHFATCTSEACPSSVFSFALYPLLPYCIWQLGYYLKTETRLFRFTHYISVAEDDALMTSLKWMVKKSPKGFIGRNLKKFSPAMQTVVFMAGQLVFTIFSCLPTVLFYRSFWAHTIYCIAIVIACIWNGANYYFEIFTSRYQHRRLTTKESKDLLTTASRMIEKVQEEQEEDASEPLTSPSTQPTYDSSSDGSNLNEPQSQPLSL